MDSFVCTYVIEESYRGSFMPSGVSKNSLYRPTDGSSKPSKSIGECDLEDALTASHHERGEYGNINSCKY